MNILGHTGHNPAAPHSYRIGSPRLRGVTVEHILAVTCSAPQPCTEAGLHPTVVHFSATAMLSDHGRVTSPIDDSRGPTDKQIGRRLAALREVMGFDVKALTRPVKPPNR